MKQAERCAFQFAMATYLWSTGDSSRCITVDSSGTFSVTVTDENGCSSTCETVVLNLISDTSQWEGGPIRDGYLDAKIFPESFHRISNGRIYKQGIQFACRD